jgi:hypothetical protein
MYWLGVTSQDHVPGEELRGLRGRLPQLTDAAWLRQRQVVEMASVRSIASEIGCNRSTVHRALVIAG